MDMTVNNINPSVIDVRQQASAVGTVSGEQLPAKGREGGSETSHAANAVNNQSLEEITKKIEDSVANSNISLDFSRYGEKSDKISVTVKEKESGKIIREIPPEELQRLQIKMEELVGILLNERV